MAAWSGAPGETRIRHLVPCGVERWPPGWFPVVMTRTARVPGNLAAETSSFVGRRHEAAELRSKLASARIISLVGPGGVGKTRLAVRAATDLARGFADGAWLVELAEVRDPALVPNAAARALALRDQAPGGALALLLSYLADKELLLVLDNCEHLLDAAAQLATSVVEAAPQVRVLATSREPLSVPAEQVLPVPPLELPFADDAEPLGLLGQNEAVSLFIQRADAASGTFELTDDNRSAVVGLCRRLDGLPLALELAAVRTRVLSVQQILAHLDDRFALLTSGNRVALPRHQTLRTTLDWSYELLPARSQAVLRRLSLFAGRFTLEDAEAICGSGEGPWRVLDSLSSLVDKSLLLKEDVGPVASFRLHETTREYAAEKLRNAGEEQTAHRDFGNYYVSRCREAADGARFRIVEWLEWADLEIDNLRAVLHRLRSDGDHEQGLQLVGALVWYWVTRATTEGQRWLDLFLDAAPDDPRTNTGAHFLRGFLAILQANPTTARRELERAADAERAAGTSRQLAETLAMASVAANMAGDHASGQRLCDEARAAAEELKDAEAMLASFQAEAMNGFFSGDLETFRTASSQAEPLSRAAGDLYTLEIWLMNQGIAALLTQSEDPTPHLTEALQLADRIDDRVSQLHLVGAIGVQAAASGDARRAARLFGATERLRTETGAKVNPVLAPLLEDRGDSLRAQLGGASYDTEFRAGVTMSRSNALLLALGSSSPREQAGLRAVLAPLAKRETEVARLISQGLTNRQIGSRLFISERTVENHVRNIMDKLGFTSRTQIAAWVTLTNPLTRDS
jgi:predicted ATPase/DNA-binding CsgD family transcriptional regulator